MGPVVLLIRQLYNRQALQPHSKNCQKLRLFCLARPSHPFVRKVRIQCVRSAGARPPPMTRSVYLLYPAGKLSPCPWPRGPLCGQRILQDKNLDCWVSGRTSYREIEALIVYSAGVVRVWDGIFNSDRRCFRGARKKPAVKDYRDPASSSINKSPVQVK